MRIALRALAVVGVIAALVFIAAAVAIATIDVNALAGPLRERVRAATGREFSIGSIALTRSLTPRLVLENVALANAPWGSTPQLLTARRLAVQVRLLPLLRGRVEIVRIELDAPVIALETRRDGLANWTFEPATEAKPSSAAQSSAGAASLAALTLGNFAAEDGRVTYRDDASGRVTTIRIDTLGLATKGPQAALDVQYRGTVDGVAVEFDGDLGPLPGLTALRGPQRVSVHGRIAGTPAAFGARIAREGAALRLDDLDVAYGANRVTGRLSIATGGSRPRAQFRLAAGTLAVADLPAPPGAGAAAAPAHPAEGRTYVFPPASVDLAPLRAVDAAGDVAVDRLTLRDGGRLDKVHAHIALDDGRAEISQFGAALYGGVANGRLSVTAPGDAPARLALRLDAKGLDLGALVAAAGMARDVRGGKTDVTLDLAMRGDSPRQWASTVSGTATAVVGPATFVNSKIDTSVTFNRLAELVNPFRGVDATTELECAVIRLPLKDGVAHVDRSIAMQTARIGVAASGTIDLRDETLNLAIKPKARKGIPVDLVRLADLVRVRGPLSAPAVAIDAKGSAETLAQLGAAYASGGLSALGESLLAHGEAGDECAAALGRAAPPAARSAQPAPAPQAKSPVEDLGKALERLLHR